MSINVTVTGNPVSINRGKMVTACACNDPQKEEFERRRLMRLEQVRQQSKDIAENIRTRVRNEKKKQCGLFEKESEKKLKDWQARKLLELHNQYQESLKDIGLGHKEAEVFEGIEEDLKTKREYQREIAVERGRLARERQQQNLKCSSGPMQPRKSLTKDVKSAEETRGQKQCSRCSPTKHFYTIVDKSDGGTTIQVSPQTESASEDAGSDFVEETSVGSSENGVSSGSSPRRPRVGLENAISAGDAEEREFDSSGGCGSALKRFATCRFPKKTIEEVSKDNRKKSVKNGAKGLGRISENDEDLQFEEDTEDDDGGAAKSRLQSRGKSSRKVDGKQFGQEGPSKRGKSLEKVKSSHMGPEDEDLKIREGPSKSRSFERGKGRQNVAKQSGVAMDDLETSESFQRGRKSRAKTVDKVAAAKKAQDAEDEGPRISSKPSKSRAYVQLGDDAMDEDSQDPSNSRPQRSRPRQSEVEMDYLEVPGGPSKSRSQRVTVASGRGRRQYEDEETTMDDECERFTARSSGVVENEDGGRRLSGGRGDNEKKSQLLRNSTGRHARSLSDPTTQHTTIKFPVETRISDRIKHRSAIVITPDTCDIHSDEPPLPKQISSNPNLRKPTVPHNTDTYTQVAPSIAQKAQSTTLDGAEIPENPATVALKQTESDGKSVVKGGVERIVEGDLVVGMGAGLEGEEDFLKRVERQDREAAERGRVALQKEKTRRSYEEMLRKLPVVQKQEGLNRLSGENKPEYYMSEGRLKEVERKRQFEMENAYESVFPGLKPSLITTKEVVRGEKVEREPFKVIDVSEKTQGVKVGTWDVLKKKDAQCSCCPKQTKRERQLQDLLFNLQTQKDLLLQEVDSLPKDSKLNELLGSLHDLQGRKKMEKKRTISPTSSSNPSPRKKSKTKCRKTVLVLQNMSTQTSPVPKVVGAEKVEKATSPREKSPETKRDSTKKVERATSPHKKPPEAKKPTEKVEKATAPVVICTKSGQICQRKGKETTPYEHEGQIVVEDEKLCEIVIKIHENDSKPEIYVEKAPSKHVKVGTKPAGGRIGGGGGTWREHFSQQSTTYTSSSTSYYSPPEVATRMRQPRLRDVLHDKEKQTNFTAKTTQTRRKLHPFIVKYIERLLTISRSAVQDLSVSSVSDVTTPASSFAETTANNPSLVHLKKLLKRLGVTYEELQEIYGKSGRHEAVLNSLSSAGEREVGGEEKKRGDWSVFELQDGETNTSLSAKVSQEDVADEDDERYREMMEKYARITDNCNKKICDLTEKIERVRMEKAQIMNSSESSGGGGGGERDNTTTAYLDLPDEGGSTVDQEKLDKMLLTIDESLAENLKRMTPTEIREKYADKDLKPITAEESQIIQQEEQQQDFEPLLKDIPKLPKFSVDESCEAAKCCGRGRPPPSKGLVVARRFNDEITGVPHELSTILEADSQPQNREIATETPKIPQLQALNSSSDELESLEQMLKDMGMGWAIATLRKTQEALALTSSTSSLDVNLQQQQNRGVVSDSSGSEVSLRAVLTRQLMAKISSSSTSTSETSVSLLLKEFEDVSAILGSGSGARDGQRTSTPIQPVSSKSNKGCSCSDQSGGGGGNDKASCTFHSLHSNGSV